MTRNNKTFIIFISPYVHILIGHMDTNVAPLCDTHNRYSDIAIGYPYIGHLYYRTTLEYLVCFEQLHHFQL